MYNIKYKVGQRVYCLKQKYREYSFHTGIIQEVNIKNLENFIITKCYPVEDTDIKYNILIGGSCTKVSQKLIIGECQEEIIEEESRGDKKIRVEKENKLKKIIKGLINKKEKEIEESIDNLINKLTIEIGVTLKENS